MRTTFSLALLLAFCSPPAAFAYKPAYPQTYKFTTPNERFVFVMYWEYDGWKERDRNLLADYPASGLYKNDSSKEMLWTVDFYRHQWEIYLLPDGVHLVRLGGPQYSISKEDLNREGVSFFAYGKLLRTYSIADLIKKPEECLPSSRGWTSIGGPNVYWVKETNPDEERLQYRIITWDKQQIVFDVTTGEIISRTAVVEPWLYVVVFGGVAIAAVCCSWWLASRRKLSAAV